MVNTIFYIGLEDVRLTGGPWAPRAPLGPDTPVGPYTNTQKTELSPLQEYKVYTNNTVM